MPRFVQGSRVAGCVLAIIGLGPSSVDAAKPRIDVVTMTNGDRTTGEIVPSPIKPDTLPGTYKAKIIPFEEANGNLERIDTQGRMPG